MADYHKVGLLTCRDNRILLCRKKHTTSLLILPGGRLELGETPLECLARELREELGEVEAVNLSFLGSYTDRAAGQESTKTVQVDLYAGDIKGDPTPQSEIRELVWFGPNDDPIQLAPSLANKIIPDLKSRSLLPW